VAVFLPNNEQAVKFSTEHWIFDISRNIFLKKLKKFQQTAKSENSFSLCTLLKSGPQRPLISPSRDGIQGRHIPSHLSSAKGQ